MQHKTGGCHLPFGQAASLWWQNACGWSRRLLHPTQMESPPELHWWVTACNSRMLQRKEAKKGLGWEKCSLHCKKMSPTQMGSYAHLLIYTSTLISMKGFNNYYMINYWFYSCLICLISNTLMVLLYLLILRIEKLASCINQIPGVIDLMLFHFLNL